MNQYKRLNIIFGWTSFIVAATVYLMTMEPTVSLWDCGEFIASAYKLEVGHPPGAPFFMIMARFFSLFASDPSKVAMMVNSMSALASAFTILFLFWTITHLAKKIFTNNNDVLTEGKTWAIIGSGLTGALAYTFSDTFWFSAVEGEVYAFSSLFTAVVFWAILKWENEADRKYSNRWLILIAYLMGLSIGVHLLNLLAIPAIVLVYYFKKHEVTRNGIIGAMVISIVLLGSVMYGIIPGMANIASKFELLFVNKFGLGYDTGVIAYVIILLGSLIVGIYYSHKKGNELIAAIATILSVLLLGIPFMSDSGVVNFLLLAAFSGFIYFLKEKTVLLNSILLFLTVIVIGYSSFAMIVIRSQADPPMDENNPDNVFALLSYLNREQYGDRPLFYGQYYSAPMVDVINEKPVYSQFDEKYKITDYKRKVVYHNKVSTFFPRMYSSDQSHIQQYQQWADIKGRRIEIRVNNRKQRILKPTFGENLKFFFKYQMGFMYGRYFMWNFAGRQNDEQSYGEMTNGNWISGIGFFDQPRIGPTKNLAERMKNHHGRNVYYFLPLLLGIFGLVFHMQKHTKDFVVVLFLFILTGIAIVIYLNQTPLQPRERDYAYAGSFYAFSIWIGLGMLSIFEGLKKLLSEKPNAIISTLLCIALVPGLMASENWDDHDRSGRYTARDLARNYLESCAPNAILFTNGDNDTFPLWYAQEVEGIRTDVRVCNLMLLNTDWYIDQMKRKAYESDPLPISMTKKQYIQGTRDLAFLRNETPVYLDIKDAMTLIKSDDPRTKVMLQSGSSADKLPTRNFKMDVDVDKVLETGTVKPDDAHLIDSVIMWNIGMERITKSDIAVLDILANNNWERPIYFVSLGHSGTLNLNQYMQLEGFAYRFVPIKSTYSSVIDAGRINTEVMYDNLMNKFTWGRMEEEDVLVDYYNARTYSVMQIRNKFVRLAEALIEEGKKDKALAVIKKGFEILPDYKVPYDYFNIQMLAILYDINDGEPEYANTHAKIFFDTLTDLLDYYNSLDAKYMENVSQDFRMQTTILMQLKQMCQVYYPDLAGEIDLKLAGYRLNQ